MQKTIFTLCLSLVSLLLPNLSLGVCVKAVSTTSIIAEVVAHIGAEHVTVKSLMGAGVDPHSYKASAGDLHRLQSAEVIFFNGLYLEAKLAEILQSLDKGYAVTANIPAGLLINKSANSNLADPHVWMSAELWQYAAQEVQRVLSLYCPAQKKLFAKNTAAYTQHLLKLHNYAVQKISSVPPKIRVLVTAHDAFQYFGRSYNIEVLGVQGISTVSEASIAKIHQLTNTIVDRKIPAIFVESSVSPKTILALQAAVNSKGFNVRLGGELFSDSLGPKGQPTDNYAGMFAHNVNTIVHALLQ